MEKLSDHLQYTRNLLLNRARAVSAYFKNSGGAPIADSGEPPKLAWTSEEQKQRAKEFFELASKLANKNNDKAA